MTRLSVTLCRDATLATTLADWTGRVEGLTFATGEHGYESCTGHIPMRQREALSFYDLRGLPHLRIAALGSVAWEGRLEDVALKQGGIDVTALGYWRAYSDVVYSALWSTTKLDRWRQLTLLDNAIFVPDRYETDTNNRLYIAPRKGEVFGSNPWTIGSYAYQIPDRSSRLLTNVSFSYSAVLPTGWNAHAIARDSTWGVGIDLWNLAGNGALQTGTISAAMPALSASNDNTRLCFEVYTSANPNAQLTAETGVNYLQITNPRLTTYAPPVTATAIAIGLIQMATGINTLQVLNNGSALWNTGADLTDALYEDQTPADILTALAGLGDNATPPRVWEVGVYNDRRLFLRPRGSMGRTWYVDATVLEIERSLDALANAAYTVYQDGNGRSTRTTTNVNAASVGTYGVERLRNVSAQTTSPTQAVTQRDVSLGDTATIIPRATISFDAVYDATGGRYPLWSVCAGDTIVTRSLPVGTNATIDRIRSFRITGTSYNVDTGVLQVTPESPLSQLAWMLSRREARLQVSPVGLAAG